MPCYHYSLSMLTTQLTPGFDSQPLLDIFLEKMIFNDSNALLRELTMHMKNGLIVVRTHPLGEAYHQSVY